MCTNWSSFYCPPPTRIAHTIALLLHYFCAVYDPPPTPLVYAIHHTIWVKAISCKGQAGTVSSSDTRKVNPSDTRKESVEAVQSSTSHF